MDPGPVERAMATSTRMFDAFAPPPLAVHPPGGFLGYTDLQSFLVTWLPIFFMGALVFFVWRTIKLMPNTKPQRIRPDASPAIGWEDIAGVEEAKHELQEVVEFLRDPARF